MPSWCFALSPPFTASPHPFLCFEFSPIFSLFLCLVWSLLACCCCVAARGCYLRVSHVIGRAICGVSSLGFCCLSSSSSSPFRVFGGTVSHWIRSVHFTECNGGVARDHTVFKRTIVYSHSQMQGSNDSMSFERNVRCSRFVHKSGFQWAVLLSTSVAESLVLG